MDRKKINRAAVVLSVCVRKLRKIADSLEAMVSAAPALIAIVGVIMLSMLAAPVFAATQTTVNLIEGTPVVLSSTYAAATSGGDSFNNDGRTFFAVKNGGGSGMTVTVTPGNATRAVPGIGVVTKSTVSVTVAASGETLIGPFPPAYFNDASGNVNVTYSAVTSVTVAAVRFVLTQ